MKAPANKMLAWLRPTVSDAARVIPERAASGRPSPIPTKIPNARTRMAMRSRNLIGPFATVKDLFNFLDSDVKR